TATIVVSVVDPNADNDGDGFTNDVELAMGTDPLSAASTPFGMPKPAAGGAPAGKKLGIELTFNIPNVDNITMSGKLPLPGSFKLLNQYIVFNIGHVVKAFQLDSHGAASGSTGKPGLLNDSLRVSHSGNFVLKLRRGAFQAQFASEPDPS